MSLLSTTVARRSREARAYVALIYTLLISGGVTADEVERAKTRLRAAVVYARDSLQTGARAIGEAITTGTGIQQVETWPSRIAAVTPEEVTAAARAVLREEGSVTGVLLPKPSS